MECVISYGFCQCFSTLFMSVCYALFLKVVFTSPFQEKSEVTFVLKVTVLITRSFSQKEVKVEIGQGISNAQLWPTLFLASEV